MIRHGFSVANNEHRFAGNSDIPLTDLGRAQAEQCAEALKNEKIDSIYASDLSRAFDTAVPVARALGLEITATKSLREIFAGEWEGKTFDQIDREYHDEFAVWKQDIGRARCTGGESVAELQKRFLTELERIAEENAGKSIFIFTHATPIRVTKAAIDGCALDEIKNIPWPTNASVTHVECKDGELRMVEYDKCDFMGELLTVLPKTV